MILSKKIQHFDFFYPLSETPKPTVAISACLNGRLVRYDKKNKALSTRSLLSQYLQLLERCPEVDAGMSVPRPAIQLVQTHHGLRALGRNNSTLDVTQSLLKQRDKDLHRLTQQNICGYIFKSKSPSCGVNSTAIFDTSGHQVAMGSGLQAQYFSDNMPWLIIREETQLQTQAQCETFIFLCLLMKQLQQAINNDELSHFNHHYQTILGINNEAARKSLLETTEDRDYTRYIMIFKKTVEHFLCNKSNLHNQL